MSDNARRGRHAGASKKNIAKVTASVAVTGGLVAGVAPAVTSGSSAAAPASASHPTLKSTAAAASPRTGAAAKTQSTKTPVGPRHFASKVDDAKKAAPQVSRSEARRALSTHHLDRGAVAKHASDGVASWQRSSSHVAATVKRSAQTPASTPRSVALASTADSVAGGAQKTAGQQTFTARAATAPVKKAAPKTATPETFTAKTATTDTAKTTTTAQTASAATSSSGVIAAAQRYSGIPYVWGGSSTSGADCSGYVAMVYRSVGKTLPHNSSAMQAAATPVSSPQPGDLVFTPGHVGIYAGNGKAYQALHPGTTSGLYPIYGSGVSYGRV